ncbi:MAG: hypothetical protein V4506_05270 [Bacteroidota bacterium]
MGQILHPDTYEFNGPWLLDKDDFSSLQEILDSICKDLEASFVTEVTDYVKQSFPGISGVEITRQVEESKNDFPFGIKRKHSYFQAGNSTKLIGNSLNEIIIDKNLTTFKPKEFFFSILFSDRNRFSISLNKYNDDRLKYELICFDQQIGDELKDRLDSWIEKKKPKIHTSWWSRYGDSFQGFVAFAAIVLALIAFLPSETTNSDYLKGQARELIKKGIKQDSIAKAVELCLKIQVDYQDSNFKPIKETADPIYSRLFIFSIILLVASIVRPKTTIGLGHNKSKLKFYKFWEKLITYTIPSLLIVSPFLDKLMEWWKK